VTEEEGEGWRRRRRRSSHVLFSSLNRGEDARISDEESVREIRTEKETLPLPQEREREQERGRDRERERGRRTRQGVDIVTDTGKERLLVTPRGHWLAYPLRCRGY
jgi:hypothetical protein